MKKRTPKNARIVAKAKKKRLFPSINQKGYRIIKNGNRNNTG
jgi:hypothetical protein